MTSRAGWWRFSTSATMPTSAAGPFACAVTSSKFFPLTTRMPTRIELFGDEIRLSFTNRPACSARSARSTRVCPSIPRATTSCSRSGGRPRLRRSSRSWPGGRRSWRRRADGRIAARAPADTIDLEMIKSVGYCHGIENYSRHFSGRLPGEPPPTLLDYFRATTCSSSTSRTSRFHSCTACARRPPRKQNLVDYGFRLPSAMDNRR